MSIYYIYYSYINKTQAITNRNNIMKDSNYKGFLLMLTASQRARLQTKANQATDGNITKLLQAYADNVEIK